MNLFYAYEKHSEIEKYLSHPTAFYAVRLNVALTLHVFLIKNIPSVCSPLTYSGDPSSNPSGVSNPVWYCGKVGGGRASYP